MGKHGFSGSRYREGAPDITTTGAGKNYDGHRIFHMISTGRIERIEDDGSVNPAKAEDISRFRRDLTAASARDKKVREYLERFPFLKEARQDIDGMKPEPEGLAQPVSPSAGETGGTPREAAPAAQPLTKR